MSVTDIISPSHLLASYGLIGIIFIIFAETGLLVGFFFPGDTLLFLAGAYAATSKPGEPHFTLAALLIGVAIAAIAGGQVGYIIGRVMGERIFSNPKARIIKPHYIKKTQEVLEKYGEMKAVMLARVIPVVRTFIGPVVGAIKMPVRNFIIANVVGGLVWSIGITLLGYALGSTINIDKYILPVTGIVVLATLIPVGIEYFKPRRPIK